MAVPMTSARAEVKAALQAALGIDWPVLDDRLHESLGSEGAVAATSPEEERAGATQQVLEMRILVQVYGSWDKRVDNTQAVDPATIEALAHAFAVEISSRQTQGEPYLWYLELERTWYPRDPTGNRTRFEAVVLARSNNAAVLGETSA